MTKTCQNPDCAKQFEPKRTTAQFCSPSCKLKAYRKALEEQAHPDPAETFNPQLVEALDGATLYHGSLPRVREIELPLTTGENTIPVSDTQNWKRPNYWLRLRDLSPEEAKAFHSWLKETGRVCPTDPTLPSGEQDFFHPWAYSEFKNPASAGGTSANPPLDTQPKTMPKELLQIPPGLPLNDGSAECMHERMKRVKSYNSTMPPKHCLTESKLKALLTRAGYSPSLAKLAFPKS